MSSRPSSCFQVWRCISFIMFVDIALCMRLNVDKLVVDRSSRKDKSSGSGSVSSSAAHKIHDRSHDGDVARGSGRDRSFHRNLLSRSSPDAFSPNMSHSIFSRPINDSKNHSRDDLSSLLALDASSRNHNKLWEKSWYHHLHASMQKGLMRITTDGKSTGTSFNIDDHLKSWLIVACISVALCCCCMSLSSEEAGPETPREDSSAVSTQGSIGKRAKGVARKPTMMLKSWMGKKDASSSGSFSASFQRLIGKKKEKPVQYGAKSIKKSTYQGSGGSADGEQDNESSESDDEPALKPNYDEDDSSASATATKTRAERWKNRLIGQSAGSSQQSS